MNGKQTALTAVIGTALLATVMTVSLPDPALALSHLNLDGNFTPNSDIADDGIDSSSTTDNTDEEENDADDEDSDTAILDGGNEKEVSEDGNDNSNAEEDSSRIAYPMGCLSNVEAEMEQEVQDCIESFYEGVDSSENANDSEDEDEDEDEE
jgi:hypothetical protein